MMICRHCMKNKVNRPRGLCWSCYYTPGVRALYGIEESKHTRRGVGIVVGTRQLPPEPTTALPASEEKLAVLERRAAAGYALWHPDDNPGEDAT